MILAAVYAHSVQAHDGFDITHAHARVDILAYYLAFYGYANVMCVNAIRVCQTMFPDAARTVPRSARGLTGIISAALFGMAWTSIRLTVLFVIFFGGHFHDALLLHIGALCLAASDLSYILGITYPPLAREWAERRKGAEAVSP